jgi:ATP-dependent RNA helicase DDX23/PRP28
MGAGLRKKPTRRDNDDVNHQKSTGKEDVLNNVMTKPLKEMTKRDWRIVRENCDIAVRGGKAPPPLRTFRESSSADVPAIHPALVDAIENVLKYKQPSPIQRQAIPIGLQRRDLIGVAETGSGKTAAFGIPLCHLILTLPEQVLHSVAENGPLALVMAPTRELAIQIDVEFKRLLSRQSNIKTSCIVGGQSIQHQAMELRNGVHIVVGTPGRINDCIENAYLVLNQCSYIVLDEADRMIDLGFAPQIESILESMGGLLKSEDEAEAYEQEVSDLNGIPFRVPKYRLTAMFSATMPAESSG